MEYLNNPVNKDDQLKQIIQDTDEIIRNFRGIAEIIAEKIEYSQDSMLNLGMKIVHQRENGQDSESNPGEDQISFI